MSDASWSVHAAEPLPANSQKRQSDMTYCIFDSLDTVCLDEWNRVLSNSGSNVFMHPRLLRALETTMSCVSRFRYILFYNKAVEPIACAVLTTFHMDLEIIAGAGTQRMTKLLRRILPSLLRVTVLFCGLPLSAGQKSLLIAPNANANDVILLLDSIADQVATEEKARAIIYKEFEDKDVELDILIRRGYRKGNSLDMHHFHTALATLRRTKTASVLTTAIECFAHNGSSQMPDCGRRGTETRRAFSECTRQRYIIFMKQYLRRQRTN